MQLVSDRNLIEGQQENLVTHLRIVSEYGYMEDDETHQFHHDGNEWRLMCCYNEPATQWIRNKESLSALNNSYTPKPEAQIYQLKPGDIWLQAGIQNWGIDPFIHKAPRAYPDCYRLLCVS
jgi:hypothetical protein